MKSLPFLNHWNRVTGLALWLGVALGFLSGLLFISVPFEHSMSLGHYRLAIFWSTVSSAAGLSVLSIKQSNFQTLFFDEMDAEALQQTRRRVFSTYWRTFLVTALFVFFSYFLIRSQIQWTTQAITAIQSILYAGYGLMTWLYQRDEKQTLIRKYHPLPELDVSALNGL